MKPVISLEDEIRDLKVLFGVTTNRDLALKMGMAANMVSRWRARGNIPEHIRVMAECKRAGVAVQRPYLRKANALPWFKQPLDLKPCANGSIDSNSVFHRIARGEKP